MESCRWLVLDKQTSMSAHVAKNRKQRSKMDNINEKFWTPSQLKLCQIWHLASLNSLDDEEGTTWCLEAWSIASPAAKRFYHRPRVWCRASEISGAHFRNGPNFLWLTYCRRGFIGGVSTFWVERKICSVFL